MSNGFCGIDIAKDSFHAAKIDHRGQLLWSRVFPMSAEGFGRFLEDLQPEVPSLGMESTGSYYLPLFVFLRERGLEVTLINPLLIVNFAKLSLRKTKTDKRDASTIAEFLRANASSLLPSGAAIEELRILSRQREALLRLIAATKTEIKRLLTILFPEALRLLNPFNVASLRLLSAFPSKDAVRKASIQALRRVLSGQGRGRRLSLDPAVLLEAARTSVGVSSTAYEFVLQSKIRVLEHLQEEEAAVTHLLVEYCQAQAAQDMALLNSIPGLSDVSSAHFLAETHGRSFASPRQLIAFAGVDPAVDQSGQRQGRGRISKRGNKSLRRVLYLMAVAVSRVNPTFRALYERKRAQGKPYVQAILAVVHKLIRIIHAMLAHRTSFVPGTISL
jgi:transposase